MTTETTKLKMKVWFALAALGLAAFLATTGGRALAARWLRSLRVQKVQAVNVDLTAFSDPNANPALHQMVAAMISDKVNITANEKDQPADDAAAAGRLAGFQVRLLKARKDAPKLVVTGQHAVRVNVDRARLQEIIKAAGHPEIVLPDSIEGSAFTVQLPRMVHARYGNCPTPVTATNAIASQVIETPSSGTEYADCIRLNEGPSPIVGVPAGLDIAKLAEIGLQVAGMTPSQADDFFHTVDWKSTLTLSVPRRLRSFEQVKIAGVPGTLLTLSGRRGPGYTLLWAKDGITYALIGYGDASRAVALGDSLQ